VKTDNTEVEDLINKVLETVLQIFYRVSLPQESDEDAFPMDFYKDLVHDNWLIDVAKLFDLAAIYG
jgi:hypothetical protein